ncbi:peroxisomal membrane protein PMP34-like [Saccoglossus kowalevskii]|uniref:Peroxisomal membrane protein PMP34-like n=1 Tax=Saccoglossus kowalevskii TaxID=10224 RepID=A0ABM0GZ07_SACKO|nr:PREDICTED: peroxisomal membrane protein PMP34-like [Saccoglossus kowalevskii]
MPAATASSIFSLFSYDNLVHAVAGATGSAVSMTVFYPLDAARVRLQIDDKRKAKHTPQVIADIAQEEGISSLYKGLLPVLQSLCCSNFVYFYTYNGLKLSYYGATRTPTGFSDLAIGFIAGVTNVLITTPLWVANTRLKLQGVRLKSNADKEVKHPRYNGMIDALCKIYKDEGINILWSGTFPSLMLVANPSIQFAVYEALKRSQLPLAGTGNELSSLTIFLMGAVAKAVATIATYPLQVIQSRLRYHGNKGENGKKMGFLAMVMDLVKTRGLRGMFKGLEAKLLQTVLMAALMFLTYEKIAIFVFTLLRANISSSQHK